MGREIRRVPVGWQHPRENGRLVPLRENLKDAKRSFIEEMTEWAKAFLEDPEKHWDDYIPYQPEQDEYMPSGPWYQLFENVSEGTPLSPPFPDKGQLIEWLSNNNDFWGRKWTPEQAKAMVEAGYAMSGVFYGGKMYTSEESVLLGRDKS